MPRGRTGKYKEWLTEDSLLLLEGWARDGLTDQQISANMGIHPATFYKWMQDYPEIRKAIKKGKAPVDYEVENALLKSALGYKMKLTKPMKIKTVKRLTNKGVIEEERIEYVEEEVYIKPEVTAQIFWLKNRRAAVWREKQEITHNTADGRLADLIDGLREDNDIHTEAESVDAPMADE